MDLLAEAEAAAVETERAVERPTAKRLKTAEFGIDTTTHIAGATLKAAGVRRVVRYLSRYSWKVITAAEVADLKAHGIGIDLVFEDGARNSVLGYNQGVSDARFALAQAVGLFGGDTGGSITFAVDDGAITGAQADAYFDGCAHVLGVDRCGPYGSYDICEHMASRGFKAIFQTYAWSNGRFSPHAKIYQYSNGHSLGGVGVDYDKFCFDDCGEWWPVPAPPKPPKPKDPHHYGWFDAKHRTIGHVKLVERNAVLNYDRVRKHPIRARKAIKEYREHCRLAADRIARVVIDEAKTKGRPRDWKPYRRGWRYSQLMKRANGKRVV